MLGWLGFLGRLVEFSITKIAGKKLDLALDQRKKSAKAFLSLHDSLERFEQAALEFVYQSEQGLSSGGKRVLYRVPVEKIAKDVDVASGIFFESFNDLRQIIHLYDVELHTMLWGIQAAKLHIAALLLDLSDLRGRKSFKIDTNSPSVFSIDLSLPPKELVSIDLEEIFESKEFKEFHNIAYSKIQNFPTSMNSAELTGYPYKSMTQNRKPWPKNLLLSSVKEATFNARFSDDDREQISQFVELLGQQIELIRSARKSLSKFIKDNFSFEDLLYFRTSLEHY